MISLLEIGLFLKMSLRTLLDHLIQQSNLTLDDLSEYVTHVHIMVHLDRVALTTDHLESFMFHSSLVSARAVTWIHTNNCSIGSGETSTPQNLITYPFYLSFHVLHYHLT